jgi:hypothetical protein
MKQTETANGSLGVEAIPSMIFGERPPEINTALNRRATGIPVGVDSDSTT